MSHECVIFYVVLGGGISSCLQDANASVHEEALSCILQAQEKGLSFSSNTGVLMDILIVTLFCSKQQQIVSDANRCARELLRDSLLVSLPVLLKGTINRNLYSGLQSIICISESIGKEIAGSDGGCIPDALLSSLIDQLLRVIATAKVTLLQANEVMSRIHHYCLIVRYIVVHATDVW